nr:uncharacterized protein LOC123568778 [Macaca fascicularis]
MRQVTSIGRDPNLPGHAYGDAPITPLSLPLPVPMHKSLPLAGASVTSSAPHIRGPENITRERRHDFPGPPYLRTREPPPRVYAYLQIKGCHFLRSFWPLLIEKQNSWCRNPSSTSPRGLRNLLPSEPAPNPTSHQHGTSVPAFHWCLSENFFFDLSKIEKRLGDFSANPTLYSKEFRYLCQAYDLTWHDLQVILSSSLNPEEKERILAAARQHADQWHLTDATVPLGEMAVPFIEPDWDYQPQQPGRHRRTL